MTGRDPRTSKFGATVADAEIMLRRAKHCYVIVKVGTDALDTTIIEVPKRALASELKRLAGGKPMPCELDDSDADLVGVRMFIGSLTAIREAAGARR